MPETIVYFATNRRPNRAKNPTDFTSEFVGDLNSIRLGAASLPGAALYEINSEAKLDALGDAAQISIAPEKLDPKDAANSTLGSSAVFSAIRKEMLQGQDLLFLIHGYDHTFRQALARAAQIKQWLSGRPAVLFLYSWPSLGAGVSPKTYDDDRSRAEASGAAIGRTILKATDFIRAQCREEPCEQRIHLMAHSMGNWALRGAIQYMRTFVGDNIPPLIDEALLLAADEDDDTLSVRHKLQPLLRGCRRVSVYYNRQDLALKASDTVMGNPDRLGLTGPEEAAALPRKVVPVNVSPVIYLERPSANRRWQEDKTGHQYYRNNDLVQKDMLQVLAGKADDEIDGREERDVGWVLPRSQVPAPRNGGR